MMVLGGWRISRGVDGEGGWSRRCCPSFTWEEDMEMVISGVWCLGGLMIGEALKVAAVKGVLGGGRL
jgi:hypothetical protein